MTHPATMLLTDRSAEGTHEDLARRYTEVARPHYGPVFQFIARQVGTVADAEELTQLTFVEGFNAFHRFDRSRPFAPWIYTIARRTVVDFYRRRKVILEALPETLVDAGSAPDEAAGAGEAAHHLWDQARHLKPRLYQVLLLHYAEGFSVQETAQVMGLTNTHVKVLLYRARHALRRRLETSGIEYGGLS